MVYNQKNQKCRRRFNAILLLLTFLVWSLPSTIASAHQRKVYCMGETVLDILFRGATPITANAGGSSLNSAVSLGRAGVCTQFIGEVGVDSTATHILSFLEENHVGTSSVQRRKGMKTTVSLAYLNEKNDASYIFFMDTPKDSSTFTLPDFHKDDVLLLGSFYAVNPRNRKLVEQVLAHARQRGGIVYYDVNLRSPHASMLPQLMPFIRNIMQQASVVRASNGDLRVVYGTADADSVYHSVVAPLCTNFVCTRGADPITAFTPKNSFQYPVKKITTVSTIGAGDNFNAGFIYGIIQLGITEKQLAKGLTQDQWQKLVDYAQQFSQDCCKHLGNYISEEFAKQLNNK